MSDLVVRGLSADVGGRPLLRGIEFRIPAGKLHVLLGPSGCGKTTLLKSLAGLHPITNGDVLVDARSVRNEPPERRGLVLVHQEDTLFPHLGVAANVAFGLRVRGRAARDAERSADELLRLVGLDGFGRRKVAGLSGGERQRVALARALAVEPKVLLLDEPFSSLDRSLRQGLRAELRRVQRESGVTALFVTHDQEEAFSLGDSILLMDGGRLVDQGPVARVFRTPVSPAAARVLGRRNLWPYERKGEVLETEAGPLPAPRDRDLPPRGWLLVNDEDIGLAPDPAGDARIHHVEFLGTRTVYHVPSGRVEVRVEAPGVPVATIGQAVRIDWPVPRFQFFPDEPPSPQS